MKKYKQTILIPLIIIGTIFLIFSIHYLFEVNGINQQMQNLFEDNQKVSLRKFPYPYKAALSLCSDIDYTQTAEEFLIIQQFLNSRDTTDIGCGVGLEIGNSFYFYDRPERNWFSYFSQNSVDQKIIRRLIHAGYIDCIHSFGEGYHLREDAVKALDDLVQYDCFVPVWINHYEVESNLGTWFPTCFGDNKDSQFYHADITIPYGIRFVNLGSSTYVIGQSTSIGLSTFLNSYDSHFKLKSLRNILKTWVKHIISIYGFYPGKYHMHKSNELVKITVLDDGQKVYEFMRYELHPDGIGKGANSRGIAYNISKDILEKLKSVRGFAVLYTHFGNNEDCNEVIAQETREALRLLAEEHRHGEVYVTTTSKLLNYYVNRKYLRWHWKELSDTVFIHIRSVDDPIFGSFIPTVKDLQGVTFYINSGKSVVLKIGDQMIKNFNRNTKDETDRISVSIPLDPLHYPFHFVDEALRLN